jgi:glycosyltransferase involved in cell wall biosynthesis
VRLSVIVITMNEEAAIARCLDSVRWADEVVVVDSGSSDRTVEICRGFGAKVEVMADWPGFGPQKNRALAKASGDWVLSIDADEWVAPELRDEIRAVILRPDAEPAYALPRLSSFCGRYMRHSGWWPDRVVRLFRRGAARFSDHLVHEQLEVNGTVGCLRQALMHESFTSFEEVIEKMDRYSSAGARMMVEGGRDGSLSSAISHGLWTFVRTYLLRLGFLDGREGLMLAVSNAEGTYYRYLKAWLLKRKA